MQYIRILGRNIRDAFKGVFRNLSLSMASITVCEIKHGTPNLSATATIL